MLGYLFLEHPIIYSIIIVVVLISLLYIINKFYEFLIGHVFKKTKTHLDDDLASLIKNIFMMMTILIGFYSISQAFSLDGQTKELFRNTLVVGSTIILTFGILMISKISFKEIERRHIKGRSNDIGNIIPLIDGVFSISILVIGILIILSFLGIDITPALASAGVIGVAIAFAAKDFVANLFGGISVFFDKSYKIGDYVIIDEKYRGEVIDIGMRSTRIRTRDDILLTVPNSVMITKAVINETGFDSKLRVRIPLQIVYESNLQLVEQTLIDIGSIHKEVFSNPPPKIRYREFTDSGILLEFLFVIKEPANRGRVKHELIKEIHKVFSEKNISISYPHRDIYLYNNKRRQ